MNRKWLGCSHAIILLALAAPGRCQAPYATDLGITRYVVRIEPDFGRNTVACAVRALVENFSSRAAGEVEVSLCFGEGADTFEHEMRTIASQMNGRREPAEFTFNRKKAGAGGLPDRPVYRIPLKTSLPPGGRIWLEFEYVLRGKPGQSAFPIFDNAGAVKELYMSYDYEWLPRISYQSAPGVFSNLCRPAWELQVSYPSAYTSVVDGELVRQDVARGLKVEQWKSVTGGVPQILIGPYEVIRAERDGLKLEMCVPREDGLKTLASSAAADMFKTLELYFRLFGAPGGSTYRFVSSYTRNGAHGLHMGQVVQSDYLRTLDMETIAHEMSHTWWGFSVSSYNEGSKFLRESLAGFSAAWAMKELRGPAYYRNSLLRCKVDTFFPYPARNADLKQYPVIEQAGYDSTGIVRAGYRKGPLVLDELRRELGDPVFFACLGAFARKYRNRNATMADFVQTFDETSKKTLDARFKELCWKAGSASYELAGFASVAQGDRFVNTVRIRNTGEMAVRCPILLTMREGEKRDEFTCASGTETELRFQTPREVVRVVLDPDLDAFQYRPEQKFPAWAQLDESSFAGNNWSWFNKSYANYRLGRYLQAVRTLTNHIDRYMAINKIAGIQELGRNPLYACYLFSRGLYHDRQSQADLAEADIKAAIPGLAAYLSEKRPFAAMAYAGIVGEKTPEKDLMSLLSLLTGKELKLDGLAGDEARKQAIEDWIQGWEAQVGSAKLNFKALDRYPAGN